MNMDTDVIIIGAGPAGISAAIKLEESGIDYLLFDRDLNPGEEKPCAGYIPISTINTFWLVFIFIMIKYLQYLLKLIAEKSKGFKWRKREWINYCK